uniref:Uncharacterized protein n=1 Tax=Ditylenchus dipsaci TaxID=166011 RepID=A0A915DV94_9BILA
MKSFYAILREGVPRTTHFQSEEAFDEIIHDGRQDESGFIEQMSGQIVALTSDGWQKPSTSLIHWDDSKFKRHDYVLAVNPYKSPRHTSVNIRQLRRGTLYERVPVRIKQKKVKEDIDQSMKKLPDYALYPTSMTFGLKNEELQEEPRMLTNQRK